GPPSWLRQAFPASLAPEVADAASQLSIVPNHASRVEHAVVANESLEIPARLDGPEPGTTATTSSIVHALFTRHNDGRVRERHLLALLSRGDAFVPAYVLLLLGEYVIEIIEDIAHALEPDVPQRYVTFARQNPALIALLEQRATSYWNCYWRGRFLRREDYP